MVNLEDLPEVDVIVISHDHYDHLDMETIEFFVGNKFICSRTILYKPIKTLV